MIKIILVLCFCLSTLLACKNNNRSSKETTEENKKEMPMPEKSETPETIAQEWCNLNGKVFAAAEGAEKETAKAARKKFETQMQEKYKDNQAMLDNVGKAIEACEDASEGKN